MYMWTLENYNAKYIKNSVLFKQIHSCFHLNLSLCNRQKTEEIFINPGILMWYWRWQLIPFKTRKRIDVAVEVISHEPWLILSHIFEKCYISRSSTGRKRFWRSLICICVLYWPDRLFVLTNEVINFCATKWNKS